MLLLVLFIGISYLLIDPWWYDTADIIFGFIMRAIISAALVLIIGMIIYYLMPGQYENRDLKASIYSMGLGSEVQGSFVLGFGTVDEVKRYYFYIEDSNGDKLLQSAVASETRIRLTDSQKPQLIISQMRDSTKWKRFVIWPVKPEWSTVQQVLIAPSKAITQRYDLNL